MQSKGVLYTSDMTTKLLLVCGAIAGPFFTIAWLVEGATRTNYNPLRHPISSLSIGELGWTQSANFSITGLLMLAFAFGLGRILAPRSGSRWAPRLIGIIAIGLLGAALFVTDPYEWLSSRKSRPVPAIQRAWPPPSALLSLCLLGLADRLFCVRAAVQEMG